MRYYSPHALQIELPSASLLQRGVSRVPQLIQGNRTGDVPFAVKGGSSPGKRLFPDCKESYEVNSFWNRCTASECAIDGEVDNEWSCLMGSVALGLNCCNLDREDNDELCMLITGGSRTMGDIFCAVRFQGLVSNVPSGN
jgi:hypothetical protein